MLVAAHLMRVTLHIVPTKEFPMYFQATRDALRKFLKNRGLPWPPKITRTHRAILDFIDENEVVTTLEIRRFLDSKGLPSDNLHRIIHYELAGVGAVLRSERKPKAPTQWKWTTTERLIDKSSIEKVTEEQAKEWLVQKYLQAFGPSSIEDIVSYTWYTRTETKKIIQRLVSRGIVTNINVDDVSKHWILCNDISKLGEFKIEKTSEKFSAVHILPELDPLTFFGYRRRWKRFISVPSIRPGLRGHPAPGIILVNGQIFGKYLVWPDFALFFNVKDKETKIIETILRRFEEMAVMKGTHVFCIKVIDGKEVASKELKSTLSHFIKSGYSMQKGRLCKKL
jgi:hypothetical protein